MEDIGLNKCELFEYILIALACPLALPFIELQEREENKYVRCKEMPYL